MIGGTSLRAASAVLRAQLSRCCVEKASAYHARLDECGADVERRHLRARCGAKALDPLFGDVYGEKAGKVIWPPMLDICSNRRSEDRASAGFPTGRLRREPTTTGRLLAVWPSALLKPHPSSDVGRSPSHGVHNLPNRLPERSQQPHTGGLQN
jgi:hypothetical protein